MNGLPEWKIPPSVLSAIHPIGIDPEAINWGKIRLAPLWVSLYGLFEVSGLCSYVGQTVHPSGRRLQHFKKFDRLFCFRVFRTCHYRQANRLEKQIIRAYKRKGQAELNKSVRGSVECLIWGLPVICPKLNKLFISPFHAGQFFGCSHTTIRNAINKQSGWIDVFWSNKRRGKQQIFRCEWK